MQTDEASDFMYEKSGFKHKGISRDRFLILFIYFFKEWGATNSKRDLLFLKRQKNPRSNLFPL